MSIVDVPVYLTRGHLELQHTLFLLTFSDKLYCAPLQKQSPRVLDAGCGTGVWSIELGILPGRFPLDLAEKEKC